MKEHFEIRKEDHELNQTNIEAILEIASEEQLPADFYVKQKYDRVMGRYQIHLSDNPTDIESKEKNLKKITIKSITGKDVVREPYSMEVLYQNIMSQLNDEKIEISESKEIISNIQKIKNITSNFPE